MCSRQLDQTSGAYHVHVLVQRLPIAHVFEYAVPCRCNGYMVVDRDVFTLYDTRLTFCSANSEVDILTTCRFSLELVLHVFQLVSASSIFKDVQTGLLCSLDVLGNPI